MVVHADAVAPAMPDADSPEPSFEEALAELETLVDAMEKGDLSLEESLKSFERGVELTRICQKALAGAEQKVRILTEKSAEAELEPFQSGDD